MEVKKYVDNLMEDLKKNNPGESVILFSTCLRKES